MKDKIRLATIVSEKIVGPKSNVHDFYKMKDINSLSPYCLHNIIVLLHIP